MEAAHPETRVAAPMLVAQEAAPEASRAGSCLLFAEACTLQQRQSWSCLLLYWYLVFVVIVTEGVRRPCSVGQ